MTSTSHRKNIYDDFVYDQPETPADNASVLSALSPLVDAVRYAKREGTRDWQRLFGSFSKWTSGSTPKRVEGNKITKRRPELIPSVRRRQSSGSRIGDDLSENSTSLTPVLERHSLYRDASFDEDRPQIMPSSSVPRSPLRYRESIFGSASQSIDSRAPTPSLEGSVAPSNRSSICMLEDRENDVLSGDPREEILPAYRSPVRHSLRPRPVAVTMTQSDALHTGLKGSRELERLDRLQERLEEIRNITKTLAQPLDASTFATKTTTARQHRTLESLKTSPLRSTRRDSGPHSLIEHPSPQQSPQPSPMRSQSSPAIQPRSMVSIAKSFGEPIIAPPSAPPPPPPPPPPPALAPSTSAQSFRRRQSMRSNKTPISRSPPATTHQAESSTPTRVMRDVLDDIPTARLRSTATYRSPNGSKINNKFWEEIQAAKKQSTVIGQESRSTPLQSTPLRSSISSTARKGKSPAKLPSQWEEGDFWTRSSGGATSSLTDKLQRMAQEEAEEREWKRRLSQTHTPGSLGDELQAANKKAQEDALKRDRIQVEGSSFSLEPTTPDSSSDHATLEARRIDGDEWVFSGKQYTVNEKKRKL
ncbi:hypothetical protein BDB00DRAFT_832871 [Zychaea mexicana]|uniref:uncharacterized protein n=1 Tax=Zychaea mexicana TaxID=64656 RepID=UPI0022FE9541|nr:uncharacterized protein BDB00DRAFT_832871 [Zychaea mexicana]KAI9491405.1 hypothetical protein BDB00DRAFT_832871 [Zychaea mexicana]